MNKSVLALIVVVVLILGGLAFVKMSSKAPSMTSENPTTQTPSQPDSMTNPDIDIQDFSFSPQSITVAAGAKVVVKNLDVPGHTVTSDEEGLFDTGLIAQNQTLEFTAPTTPGTYPFHCTPHPSMKGVLIVE